MEDHGLIGGLEGGSDAGRLKGMCNIKRATSKAGRLLKSRQTFTKRKMVISLLTLTLLNCCLRFHANVSKSGTEIYNFQLFAKPRNSEASFF